MPDAPPAIIEMAKDAAQRHGVDAALVLATIEAESGFNPDAIGDNGESFGLMQLHVRGAGAGYSPAQLLDAATNVEIGTRYLARMQAATGSLIGTFGAYNAGLGGWQNGVVVWRHIEAYVQAYVRWKLALAASALGVSREWAEGVLLPRIDLVWADLDTMRGRLIELKQQAGLEE